MLCCWLQQLQEFGGPEVDKPDLLKGSIGSLKSHPQPKSAGSTTSLARNFLMDPKARYNVSTLRNKIVKIINGIYKVYNKYISTFLCEKSLKATYFHSSRPDQDVFRSSRV